MGRRRKKKLSEQDVALIAEREREKIKKSVLKVFCRRLNSPGGGGAVLARDISPHCGGTTTLNDCSKGETRSDSSMSDYAEKHTSKRHKKSTVKHSKVTSKKVKDSRKRDVSKHMKMAHDSKNGSRSSLGEDHRITSEDVSRITHNRLTRKIGLFNQGKKSSTAAREISVPDNVKRKTEEDIKRILEFSDDENRPPYILIQDSPESKGHGNFIRIHRAHSTHESSHQDVGYKSGGSILSVTPASSKSGSAPVSSSSFSGHSGGVQGSADLPSEPQYTDIAEMFALELKPRRFFPGRSLLHETREHLQKLRRQNAPRSATPTPKLLGSAKRSLMDRFHPNSEKEHHDQAVQVTSPEVKNQPPQQEQVPKNNQQKILTIQYQGPIHRIGDHIPRTGGGESNTSNTTAPPVGTVQQSKTSNQGKEHNRQVLPESRAYYCSAITESVTETKATAPGTLKPVATDTCVVKDGRILLQYNDEIAHQVRLSQEMENVLHQSTWVEERSSVAGSSLYTGSQQSRNSSQSSGYHGSQLIARLQNNTVISSNQKVVTEYHHLPDFLLDPWDASLCRDDGSVTSAPINHCLTKDQIESMDILDYLDTRIKDRPLTSEDRLNPWSVAELPPLQKPSLDTPSPPEDLFRKFNH